MTTAQPPEEPFDPSSPQTGTPSRSLSQSGTPSRPLGATSNSNWGRRATGSLGGRPPAEPPDLRRYSTTPRYDIATIAEMVTVRAVTLWSWEQNLGIIAHDAAAEAQTGLRYSERDLIILSWLRDQIVAGVDPIAAAQKIREAIVAAGGQPPPMSAAPRTPSRPLGVPQMHPLEDAATQMQAAQSPPPYVGGSASPPHTGQLQGSASPPPYVAGSPSQPHTGQLQGSASPPPYVSGSASPPPYVSGSASPPPYVSGSASPPPYVSGSASPPPYVSGPPSQPPPYAAVPPSQPHMVPMSPPGSRMPPPPMSRPLGSGPASRPLIRPAHEGGQAPWMGSIPARDPRQLVQPLVQSFAALDASSAAGILDDALVHTSIETTCLTLIAPALARVQELWVRKNDIAPEGLFGMNVLRGRLFRFFDTQPEHRDGSLAFVAAGPGEPHELSALMVALFWRRMGLRIVFFGQGVTGIGIVENARKLRPRVIALTLSTAARAQMIRRMSEDLQRLDTPIPSLCLIGEILAREPSLRKKTGGIYIGSDPAEATMQVRQIVRSMEAYR